MMPVLESHTPGWWNQRYEDGTIPWDSGITPPELHELVAEGLLKAPGVALDLGCGTGTNTIFLAQLGLRAYGIDMAQVAVAEARRKALAASASAFFCVGDVSNLDFLPVQASLALDVGCLHSLPDAGRSRYAASLARRMTPGGLFLLYGFDVEPRRERGPHGFASCEVAQRFAPDFRLHWRRPSLQDDWPVAWYLLERR